MTAEVGVLNAMGVALAADSAVSIGPNANKIYSSADKLFNLSTSAPVGIMINGNASLLGIPPVGNNNQDLSGKIKEKAISHLGRVP